MTNTHQPHFLGVAEVAERLGVHVVTVRKLIASGAMPAVRVGSHILRVRATDLDAYIHAAAVTPSKTEEN